ncbi:glycosyltransferase [Leyella stercorea]|uniref:glycosyltransferase n=1 Tax=Leyella stercorea TaxID=363265 RepID=UPI003AF7E4E8
MKIIHYIPSIDRTAGGTSTYMQVLTKGLGEIAEVHIITHASENPLAMENCTVHYVPEYNPFKGSWRKRVTEMMEEVRPDIVHVNCCWMPACAAVQRIAQKHGYKVVLTPHGMLEPWIIKRHYWTRKVPALLLYQKAAVRKADCIQSTAESERDNLLKLGYNSNIKVVKLGIDADGIEMKRSWKKTRQILFLSRVHVKKGINFLIEAAAALRSELQGYKILVAGEGDADYVAEMKRMIEDNGLQDIVQLIGGVYGEEKWRLFQSSDFFVLPTHSENFGLAIAESLASGTPVITTVGTPVITTVGTPWHDLNDTNSGAWIEIGTQPLVEMLRRFLALSDGELEAMGRNGRRLIEEKYSALVMAKEMMEVYETLIPNLTNGY